VGRLDLPDKYRDEDADPPFETECQNCGELECGDPRGHTFGYCGCEE
jgi:hypothetical protein